MKSMYAGVSWPWTGRSTVSSWPTDPSPTPWRSVTGELVGDPPARLPTGDFSRLFCRQVPAASPWKLARNLPAAVSSLNAYTVLCADVVLSAVGHSEQSGKERSENPCPAQDHPGTLARGVR
jgi:hypothetical protein